MGFPDEERNAEEGIRMAIQTIEIDDSDVRIIEALCDITLKHNGLVYLNAVNRILSLMPKPEPEASRVIQG